MEYTPIRSDIDRMIARATKDKNIYLGVLRMIKAEFLRFEKDNPGKIIDAKTEVQLLDKMRNQRLDSFNQYEEAGRKELADNEWLEYNYLNALLPEAPCDEQIEDELRVLLSKKENVSMRDFKGVSEEIKNKYPLADNKIILSIFKSLIK